MKKLFLAATLLAALTTSAFADGKKSSEKLLGDLKTVLRSVNESAWVTTESYKKTSFSMNGKNVNAYVNVETGDLIGFGIPIEMSALPEGTTENLDKKYKGWQAINPIMFIDGAGNASYFIQVNKGKNSLALSVSPKGKLNIYNRIPH
jgi:hypothetical protein